MISWNAVVASLLGGCEIVLVRPPGPPPAQVRQCLEAVLRRGRSVLLMAGDWPGVPARLRVTARRWGGLGDGYGRLRACLAEVTADGRGEVKSFAGTVRSAGGQRRGGRAGFRPPHPARGRQGWRACPRIAVRR